MAQLTNVAILVVVFAAAAILQSTEAANYTVGGSTGWINSPSGGASFYSNWAANLTFRVNDTLVFNFNTGSHTVAILTQANYDNCSVNQNIELFSTGPARVTLNRTGDFYFACTFPGHCNSGQKLSVRVTGSNSSSPAPGTAPAQSPPPPPASGTTPTPPSNAGAPSTVPGSGSATSIAATFSLLLVAIAINLSFQF